MEPGLKEAVPRGDRNRSDEESRGQFLRMVVGDTVRGAAERQFGVRLAFQNCRFSTCADQALSSMLPRLRRRRRIVSLRNPGLRPASGAWQPSSVSHLTRIGPSLTRGAGTLTVRASSAVVVHGSIRRGARQVRPGQIPRPVRPPDQCAEHLGDSSPDNCPSWRNRGTSASRIGVGGVLHAQGRADGQQLRSDRRFRHAEGVGEGVQVGRLQVLLQGAQLYIGELRQTGRLPAHRRASGAATHADRPWASGTASPGAAA